MLRITMIANLRHRLRAAQDGQAIVELGISLPLLCLMLLGAAELARVAYAAIEVSDAAHAAAQFATASQLNSGNSGGIVNAMNANSDLFGSNAISINSVTMSCTCANTAFTPTSCSDNSTCEQNNTAMIKTVTVQTKSTFSPMIHYFGAPTSYTLYGSSTQVVSNQ